MMKEMIRAALTCRGLPAECFWLLPAEWLNAFGCQWTCGIFLFNCLWTCWRTDTANQRGWMGADKNSSRRRWRLQQDEHGPQHTSPTHYLKGPWCRLEGGWIGVTTKLNSFSPNTWADSAPPVRPVVVTGQALDFTGDTGQTGAPHWSDRCSTEHLQKQLQAPLDFQHEPNLVCGLCRWSQVG
jgi:hypothetical protein